MKKKELVLATFVACHSSIRTINHLTDIFNRFSQEDQQTRQTSGASSNKQGAPSETFYLHKTKCAALIMNVVAPSLLNELLLDVGNSPFSIIVDESTDVSTEKLLCINIKYYSDKSNNIKLQFLTFISVIRTTSEDLYNAITNFLSANKFNLKKLIGVGTDGASNMCGENNSLFTLKKKLNLSNLVLVKCVCHSLHLCSSKASEVFADEIDFLLRETYNWFKYSTIRQSKYKEIFNLINLDSGKFSKFSQLSATRWLSRYRAVEKIYAQYLELETFFNIHAEKERCHTAKLLNDAFKNKKKTKLSWLS